MAVIAGTILPLSKPHLVLKSNHHQIEAAAWLARRSNGALGLREQQDFARWLNACPENRAAFEQAETVWQALGELGAGGRLHEARAFLQQQRRQRLTRRVGWALAASMVLGVAVWLAEPLSYLDDQILRTALGEQRRFTLADGTRLDLNTDSEVRVHYARRVREVHLQRGEIACEVRHEADRPFWVSSGAARIRDIGTRFNVRQYPDHHVVSVQQGVVEVSSDTMPARQLHRNEQLSYDIHGKLTAIAPVDAEAVAAWRTGHLVFERVPLQQVLNELTRYTPAHLVVSAALQNTRVSGVFNNHELPQSLRTIALGLSARLTQTGPNSWQLEAR